ncbi:tRNA (adenosine(37)-N6)-dimethylallyltransferase MiaA [Bacillus aquiflavi]|uniref:tRNA dimethylallyltransferase n=1 Tax=Bacillus aquiflavi TaxID=2672567 RepID=A0A6B3VQR7_9BACI|nr:tRNA (adenosine(37)-N6)-dimethylallyltransferase MiaA [Bacillus aquiflavi]MBA4536282.1 tRNA (adenosine(37)-N6)-dimethylallyltransferase MiaA [Bacillus aquiflavi]NEY80650.1 tRNA (adenosine(37)-N6)-dimethylallyltransferase MiaA [Bacillus aquiflavi]UAC49461.1 tRNA (adenosine(37)-N6)-dimethylallyltransferase MiaA [Bacillus aquiflavi]
MFLKEKEKLLVIIGPTAVGKTNLSIDLAKQFNAEIISGDSMQIYQGMDIGTAKISKEEMEGIPHHLIDIKKPSESFSVADFQQLVKNKIEDISERGKLPMIVGGTGLYIQSVIYNYQFSNAPSDLEFRKQMEKKVEQKGKDWLHEQLQKVDPESANRIHPNNIRRVIRALEILHCTDKTMTNFQKNESYELIYNTALIGLTMEREQLYDRINKRVDIMIQQGLVDEVKALYDQGLRGCQSVQAIGYKELYDYFDKKISLEEAIEQLKQNSRRYAKRQFTWFRNKMNVKWFNVSKLQTDPEKIAEISAYIAGKLKIKSNT